MSLLEFLSEVNKLQQKVMLGEFPNIDFISVSSYDTLNKRGNHIAIFVIDKDDVHSFSVHKGDEDKLECILNSLQDICK